MGYKLGIDVGGTFTDFLLVEESGNIIIEKVSSTPANPADAVIDGLRKLAGSGLNLPEFMKQVDLIVHGTTITTNAILTGSYAKTGYLTTKGFRDLLNERRGIKRKAFTAKEAPPPPIVPRYLIQCAEERIGCRGEEVLPLREEDVLEAARLFRREEVEAVAVNFIFSFLNPSHEHRAKELLVRELPGVYVCTSSEVLPQVRVYERGSTTVFNASVGPPLRRYVRDLVEKLEKSGFEGTLRLMQSNGGVMSPDVAMDFAVNTLLSGPASGPVAGLFYADMHRIKHIVTSDMGGTSFDCCLIIDKEPEITSENQVAEYAMAMPSLAIHTLGAGGGSIAWVDDAGVPRVGPKSAGAMPGPACYGAGGTEPTVTDADLVLGYIDPNYFLGGQMKLDPEISRRVIKERVAERLNLDIRAAAYGIYQIVNANMANGIRVASISRGADPRGCLYIVAGGAGPVHACAIADELEMDLILIPRSSSVFCASGMLISNLRHDFVRACYMQIEEGHTDTASINFHLKEMRDQAADLLEAEMIPIESRTFKNSFDLRYEGQFNEIETPIALSSEGVFSSEDIPVLKQAFDKRHDALYGYNLTGSPVELIAVRVKAEGVTEKPSFREVPFAGPDASGALKGEREIYYGGRTFGAKVYEGARVGNGNRITGPAIVEEATTTVLVAPDYDLYCDAFNNYLLFHKDKNLNDILVKLAG